MRFTILAYRVGVPPLWHIASGARCILREFTPPFEQLRVPHPLHAASDRSRGRGGVAHVLFATTDVQLAAASARGRLETEGDGARSVVYDADREEIRIVLNSGVSMSIPRKHIPGLENATTDQLRDLELSPMTTSISFPKLDADYSIRGLIRKA